MRVEPRLAGAGGSAEQRDLPELLTRDCSFACSQWLWVRKRECRLCRSWGSAFHPRRKPGDAKARDCRMALRGMSIPGGPVLRAFGRDVMAVGAAATSCRVSGLYTIYSPRQGRHIQAV